MKTTAALVLAGFLALTAHAAPPAQIVVFGDSLSDPGNAFALLGATNTPPDYSVDVFLVPDRPYAKGGQHFSNGETWVEQLARTWRLAANANPAFRSAAPSALNFAIGTARAGAPGGGNLDVQVSAFLQRSGGTAPAGALYVIAVGANDVRDAGQTPAEAFTIFQAAAQGIVTQIARLYAAGARSFLVWNAPDIGITPALLALDQLVPGSAAGASFLSQTFNDVFLAPALAEADTLPGIAISRFDAFTKLHEIVAQPQDFGLSNVTAACITPTSAPFHCRNPDEYLFWDGIHPTRAAHGIIAREVAATLSP
ncbi:MAG TPA: SGNH/GDSL hydrolase family protein [Burkholderiales bacterium]|nr:SGNH/GDSL hydrolase family protein [Burkholderiales bacterium]